MRKRRSAKGGQFPNRVRDLREKAGLTQEELGERLGLTFSAIGKLERGMTRLRIDQAAALSRVLGVHELELLFLVSSEEREAMQLIRAADPANRARMIQMLRMLAAPLDNHEAKVA